MKKNIFFILCAAMLLAPWPVAYAYDNVNAASTSLTIMAADTASAPQLNGYGNAIGSITDGDLFEIDMTGTEIDTVFRLSITNADELFPNYRFMNMKIGVLTQAAGSEAWEKLTTSGGEELQPIYISMHGGMAEFKLPGGAKYKITIEKGCFYCYGVTQATKAAVPRFYLEAG